MTVADMVRQERYARAQRERRERIATAIMAGMVARPTGVDNPARAVALADALMAELDKEGR